MSVKKFKLDLSTISANTNLAGILIDVTVDTATGITDMEYSCQGGRSYTEGQGVVGTADKWLVEAKLYLEDDNTWEAYID